MLDCCIECRGLWFDGGEVERVIGRDEARSLRERFSGLELRPVRLGCARGHGRLREVDLEPDVALDSCPACGGLWMEAGDLVRLRRHLPRPGAASDARLAGLHLRLQEAQREVDDERIDAAQETIPSTARHWLFQFLLGLPMEVYNPVRRPPVATYALIGITILVFLLQLGAPDGLIGGYALVPSAFVHRVAPWTILTSMFLHGGPLHLAGNMYFLGVFGDNVEDRLGIVEYLGLYFVGGIGAALAHIAADPTSPVPLVGASGAISAVLGAYLYFFPHRRIYMLIFFVLRRIRAVWYLGLWLLLQFSFAASGTPGVAWWAHIGGFGVGLAAAALHRAALRRRLAALEGAAD